MKEVFITLEAGEYTLTKLKQIVNDVECVAIWNKNEHDKWLNYCNQSSQGGQPLFQCQEEA